MFSSLFTSAVQIRNALYTLGALKSHLLDAPVISVGNLTVGGTGKTPLVAEIARLLVDEGERPCILTRGYGRRSPGKRVIVADGENLLVDTDEAGDEPRELAQRLSGKAVIIADADRVSAARFASEKYRPTVFILDDGFQHRRIKRDLDIVCIDATDPFGGGKTLPFGRLREPVANIARAHLIVITRSNLVTETELTALRKELEGIAPETVVVTSRNKIENYRDISDGHAEGIAPGTTFAFCGIGNPSNFFRQLESEGVELVGTHAFRDHHDYSQQDAKNLCDLAEAAGAANLVTTAKDAVKLRRLRFSIVCLAAEMAQQFEPKEKLRQAVLSAVSK